MVISQNVFFDKSRGWKWSTTRQEETCEPRMITFSVHNEKEESDKGENDNCIDDHDEEEEQEASETEDIEETDEPILRRSTRQSTRPSYLEDYVFLSELEDIDQILLMINEDPWDWNEAKEEKVWRDACEEEITSIKKNETWTLVDLPDGCKEIGLKWVFKIKRNADWSLRKYQARLEGKGYVQRNGVDCSCCEN